jgi:DNA-binding NarL/FixJ family response regulator
MRVLIVDDSSVLRERVGAMLTELTGDIELVGEAKDGIEGLDSIRRLKPDAVILDISMPGKGGIDVLREIKRDEKSPIVVMLTNHPYTQYRNKCLAAGADFFYDKSNELCKVTRTFKQLIDDPRWDRGSNICDGCPARFSCAIA